MVLFGNIAHILHLILKEKIHKETLPSGINAD